MEIPRDIGLLVLGGFITLIVHLLLQWLKSKKARIVWRTLPPVKFQADSIMALSLIIENTGGKAATNVRVKITFAKEARVGPFEIQTSEQAIPYHIYSQPEKNSNPLDFSIALFPRSQECVVAMFLEGAEPSDVKVSIVADDDVVGKPKIRDTFEEKMQKSLTEQRMFSLWGFVLVTIFVIGILLIVHLAVINQYKSEYELRLDFADAFAEQGRYDLALREYQKVPRYPWIPESPRLHSRIAKCQALLGNADKAVFYLEKLAGLDSVLAIYTMNDIAFDSIRATPEFKFFEKRIRR